MRGSWSSGAWQARRGSGRTGFSLVEVVLAVAIMAFAFVAVFGLLPTGIGLFQTSLNLSVGSLLAQRIVNDAQQADFTQLTNDDGTAPKPPFRLINPLDPAKGYVRWFDVQGNELSTAATAIYQVNTRISPGTSLPQTGNVSANPHLATITVQVVTNPGNQTLAMSSDRPNLWSGASQSNLSTNAVPMLTVSALIGKNQ